MQEILKYLYFFPSKRWDLEFKNGNTLKLPLVTSPNIFDYYYKISQSEQFKEKNVFAFVDFSDSDYAKGLDTNEINHSNIKILKLKGSLFFGSVEKLIKSFNRIPNENPVLIDMKEVQNVDLSGIFGLEDLIKLSQNQNRNVAITNANEKIRNNLIALKFVENIGSENISETPVEFFQKMNNDSRG